MVVTTCYTPGGLLALSSCGAGVGILSALAIVTYEYHAGENYAQAMKIIHS